jgi:hypothetical protein
MSLWISRKTKTGKRWLWLIDLPLLPLLAITAAFLEVFLQFVIHHPLPAALGCLILGYSTLLLAKLSLFRRGIWISWGSRLMSTTCASLYRAGYGLIALGGVVLTLTWMLTV